MPLGHQAEWLREWGYAMFARCCEHLPTRKRQLLRPRFRQSAASRSQKRLVPGWLARKRQLLHSVRSPMAVSDQHLILVRQIDRT
jgi:hypothetical protein